MILVFNDDGTVSVYENERQVQIDYEGIDVEDGAFFFVTEQGYELKPVFTEPNQRKKLLGWIEMVSSGYYKLELKSERYPDLLIDFVEGRWIFGRGTNSIRSGEDLKKLILASNPDLYQTGG